MGKYPDKFLSLFSALASATAAAYALAYVAHAEWGVNKHRSGTPGLREANPLT
jgi:hypothetical protein